MKGRPVGGVLLGAAAVVLLLASPAAAANPVLDAEGDADVVDALEQAQQVQGVCYGYALDVLDGDTGEFGGTFAASSLGEGVPASTAADGACPDGVVELQVSITYTSDFSEAEDDASWRLLSTVGGDLSIADVEQLTGIGADDLLDDSASETALLNTVLSLPVLASERAGLPPVLLEENTAALPADARATDTPGSDWLRQHTSLLALCVLAVLSGLVALAVSLRQPRRVSTGRLRTFGPTRAPAPPRRPDQARPDPYTPPPPPRRET